MYALIPQPRSRLGDQDQMVSGQQIANKPELSLSFKCVPALNSLVYYNVSILFNYTDLYQRLVLSLLSLLPLNPLPANAYDLPPLRDGLRDYHLLHLAPEQEKLPTHNLRP